MVYSFQLWRHPNIHYREAVQRLSRCELLAMLSSLSVETNIQEEYIGSAAFLTFESRPLSLAELAWLRRHSCIVFMAAGGAAGSPEVQRKNQSRFFKNDVKYRSFHEPVRSF